MILRTYSELRAIPDFKERYEYLKLKGVVGTDTFGFDRYMNQMFYKSKEWGSIRDYVITRDYGCDLGHPDFKIAGRIYVHHMNPIRPEDIKDSTDFLLNPNYLICCSYNVHQAIHYGTDKLLPQEPIIRSKNDTCPWRL